MRKHNTQFAKRWARGRDAQGNLDRSNFPQVMAHGLVKDKQVQLISNGLLCGLLKRIGIDVYADRAALLEKKLQAMEAAAVGA